MDSTKEDVAACELDVQGRMASDGEDGRRPAILRGWGGEGAMVFVMHVHM